MPDAKDAKKDPKKTEAKTAAKKNAPYHNPLTADISLRPGGWHDAEQNDIPDGLK
jgi:hypothetical protein